MDDLLHVYRRILYFVRDFGLVNGTNDIEGK